MKHLLLFLLLSASPFAYAAPLDAGARWREQLGESAAHLKASEFDKALKVSERVLRDMRERLGPGHAATEVLGIAITHKALALAGQGKNDEAVWWWHVVLSMYPAFAKSDLTGFGEPGAFLTANRELRPVEDPKATAAKEAEQNITPPRVKKKVRPDFPAGALWFGVEGMLIVQVVITEEGKVVSPRIIQPLPAPTLTYTALDALRRWRFEPGKLDGKPVDVFFNLTINFKVD